MMRPLRIMTLVAAGVIASIAGAQEPTGTVALFDRALRNDPAFSAARAQYDTDAQYGALAFSSFLPSVSYSSNADRSSYGRVDLTSPVQQNFDYKPKASVVRIVQRLYDPERLSTKRDYEVRVARAALALEDARQDLASRLAQNLFNVMLSADEIRLAEAQVAAMDAQLLRVDNLFKAGSATLTDVEETRARQQLAMVQLSTARSNFELNRKQFRQIVGHYEPQQLPAIGENLSLEHLQPANAEAWQAAAAQRHVRVAIKQLDVRLAELAVDRQSAGFLPSLTLVATRQNTRTPNYFTQSEAIQNLSLQLNMSLFEGGATLAQTRQARSQVDKARSELDGMVAEVTSKTVQAFWQVENGIAQIRALEQAVKSGQTTVAGMVAGQKAGLRTNSEVLNAQQQLFATRRDLQKERYNHLFGRLQIQIAMGQEMDTYFRDLDLLVRGEGRGGVTLEQRP